MVVVYSLIGLGVLIEFLKRTLPDNHKDMDFCRNTENAPAENSGALSLY